MPIDLNQLEAALNERFHIAGERLMRAERELADAHREIDQADKELVAVQTLIRAGHASYVEDGCTVIPISSAPRLWNKDDVDHIIANGIPAEAAAHMLRKIAWSLPLYAERFAQLQVAVAIEWQKRSVPRPLRDIAQDLRLALTNQISKAAEWEALRSIVGADVARVLWALGDFT